MLRKVKVVILMFLFTAALGLMSNTYSRYVANAQSDIMISFSKWQILVDNHDITNSSTSSINITPVIEENEFVAANTIAPSSKGYFDIDINPSNVDVSFKYNIDLSIENEEMPDIVITKYSLIDDSYVDGEELILNSIIDNKIESTMLYNNNETEFSFKPFTIRIYFEWYEGDEELMNDEDDTYISQLAIDEDLKLQMSANITFEQVIN